MSGAGSILGGVLGGLAGGGGVGGGGASSSAQAKELSRHLTTLLTEDDVQLLSTLELNRLATYSYHVDSFLGTADNDLLETMVLTLQGVLSKPASYSTTALLKGLAVTDWLITYGADRVLLEAKVLGRSIENLQSYNTVLLAQQSSGAAALFMRIKGGGVDQGGPVRAKADRVMRLLTDPTFYQQERAHKADPGSLVPVGSNKKVGFVTDEVRLHLLRRRMEEETAKSRIKSNLQKPEGGFGSGYNSRDGKSVVGAAHGIEEMLKMAQKQKDRFVDGDAMPGTPVVNAQGDLLPGFAVGGGGRQGAEPSPFSEYRAPTLAEYAAAAPPTYAYAAPPAPAPDVDLLDFSDDNNHGGGAPAVGLATTATPTMSFDEDLLGMPSSIPQVSNRGAVTAVDDDLLLLAHHPPNPLMDLAAAPSTSSDCLMAAASTTSSMSTVVTSNDLLGGGSTGGMTAVAATTTTPIDPFRGGGHVNATTRAPASTTLNGLLGSLSLSSRSSASAPYSTPSIDVTPKLPNTTINNTAATNAPPTTNNHGSFDRFAALDVLVEAGPSTAPSTASTGNHQTMGVSSYSWNPTTTGNSGFAAANAPSIASTTPSFPSSSSYAWNNSGSDRGSIGTSDDGTGGAFVMGGSTGAGLFPLGPAPAAPPPPPPPPSNTFPFY